MNITDLSPRVQELARVLTNFVENECIPAEQIYEEQIGKGDDRWKVIPPVMEELKEKARKLGLWNLFIPKGHEEGPGLTNLEYAYLCEIMGRSVRIAPEACNCGAPDTGNMEVFLKYGNKEQKEKWLKPLLEGKIRSAFAMTEPAVASSDATNIETSIKRQGDDYIINGRKWWISGAGDPRCKVFLVMGKTDTTQPKHKQQTIIIVPADTPGVTVVRPLTVFGYDHAPHGHCEVSFENVKVPKENLLLGEGRGFEIVQGRLGPGRIHHCMRAIGVAERALDTLITRASERRTFGKYISEHQIAMQDIAVSRIEIEQGRLLVFRAADMIDKIGAKKALKEIALAKVAVPSICLRVLDRAIQIHGAAGVGPDTSLADLYANMRTLRIADGPDAVHLMQIAKMELQRVPELKKKARL
ncbi:acyl-CoA dehydrogenase domain protein [Basidiobolus meristosporus CBS 931.73]|uniref:Acyl-CoA dehydrogenase domain protein n=1 Tax=Basidiobolus meristosporus CBS 931.73 TaxID=1314790 RepID=A0A1Y1Y4D0_9FUNG|nr:acyl-CoA dehydrogenase domain protein [Basidiobolus meristosporus CBS 931.73]|eukprot:ORX92576.1 acyl-CoA dehydrogenase domain protein [Basidiobolus meristosporus CBS 931.73]